ncbi:MAG: transcription termination factor Rho [Lawsonella sp.]|uniref:transcription termination factor Rho n=1 Tax=Lawsonella sp. TaxID=2041415 RepID=UPI002A747706|nr:transcription termination factor Rho [Lawsonella sp.]MDY2979057.1 transcription termination factor Rho [Lawsonella sp.]
MDNAASAEPTRSRRGKGEGLSSMVIPELRKMATEMGIKRTSGMRKGDLIEAIQAQQRNANDKEQGNKDSQPAAQNGAAASTGNTVDKGEAAADGEKKSGASEQRNDQQGQAKKDSTDNDGNDNRSRRRRNRNNRSNNGNAGGNANGGNNANAEGNSNRNSVKNGGANSPKGGNAGANGARDNSYDKNDGTQDGNNNRNRNRRDRNNNRNNNRNRDDRDTEIREGDVLQPVAGILDILDNYAFVRTSGYSAGPHDVYVSMNMVRKAGLRRGDAIVGAVRMPREGGNPNHNNRQKFNPLVRIDSVNGLTPELAAQRPEFAKLTPLYPNQRLRLETTKENITTRLIDLIMPIGKGQRALIVSPPKAGKTTVLQAIANAITTNYPECHLMVVLVDERPEEVTDMQRSVKGEVIASTFDCPPSNHTTVSELAIERAKRLVEQGMDVVVLLDSITRLGRAYNNSSPASGRILSGGVDSTALYPPKRFLGAARNIENGGSLTIIATAMVETGSAGDTVIFEEFKGTGNAELKLDRRIAERRVFPAIDLNPSGTRKDELLLGAEEYQIVHKFRRVLSGLEPIPAIELVIKQLKKTKNNREFLMQIAKTTPNMDEED